MAEGKKDILKFKKHWKKYTFCVVTLLFALGFAWAEIGGGAFFDNGMETQLVVHRGGGKFAPENTLAGLKLSIDAQASAVEIDVRQISDGTIIVLHDTNFKRTTGVDKYVWDVNYDEVKTYDAGKKYSKKYTGEPIPTLEEMLETAKGKIELMIEIKVSGEEQEIEKQVTDMIKDYGMEDQCTVASMNLGVLKNVKKIDPDIKTVYIASSLYSKDYELDYVDCYSIRQSSLTTEMVKLIHMQDKKVYSWTANTGTEIVKVVKCKADGIITDNPELTKYYLEQSMTTE